MAATCRGLSMSRACFAEHGFSLRKAHETLNRLAGGDSVAVELLGNKPGKTTGSIFAKLGVTAQLHPFAKHEREAHSRERSRLVTIGIRHPLWI